MSDIRDGRRVAVVGGCRTPFCKSGTVLKDVSAVDLAKHAVVELVHRTNLDGKDVDEMYFGQVVPSPLTPNVAREVSLLPQFPASIPAASLNRACASANAAIATGYDQIALAIRLDDDDEAQLAGKELEILGHDPIYEQGLKWLASR